jgi:hypothetical protein
MKTVKIDVMGRYTNGNWAYIPSPIAKYGPVIGYDATIYDAISLLRHPHIWIYDNATKKVINFYNVYSFFYGDGGGGSDTPSIDTYTKTEIDQKIKAVSDATNILDDKLNSIPSNLIPEHYERNTNYVAGKLLWIEPGNLYQVTEDYKSANESTTEDSLIADVANNKLVSIAISSGAGDYDTLYSQLNQLTERVSSLQNRMEFSNINSFPETGNTNTLYIDTSSGESYLWNDTTSSYQRLDMETLDDIDVIQSEIE